MNKHDLQDSIATLSAVTWSFLTVAFVQKKRKKDKKKKSRTSYPCRFTIAPEYVCAPALSLAQNSRKENKVAAVTAVKVVLQHPY